METLLNVFGRNSPEGLQEFSYIEDLQDNGFLQMREFIHIKNVQGVCYLFEVSFVLYASKMPDFREDSGLFFKDLKRISIYESYIFRRPSKSFPSLRH